MNALRLSRRRCPQCAWAITRIQRRPEDRIVSQTPPIRRYRCCDAGGCGWEGTLAVTWLDTGMEHRVRALARVRMARIAKSRFLFPALIGFAGIALGASGAKLYDTLAAAWLAGSPGTVPFGVSDFGGPLPENHPFLQQPMDAPAIAVRTAAADSAWSKDASPTESADDAPLSLRENCAWGEPGRAPYKGTVQQALKSARLPADVVALFERKIREHEISDVVEIRNDQIRGLQSDAAFEPRAIKLTFAKTLCLNSRVNFKPGHVERADLYEARDARGVTYSVMVPYVCGNVSVLGARTALDDRPSFPAQGPGAPWAQSPTPPAPRGAQPSLRSGAQGVPTLVPFSAPLNGTSVPEPGTWTLILGSLALVGWFIRRR